MGDVRAFSTYIVLVMPFLMLASAQAGFGLAPRRLVWLTIPLALVSGYLTLNRMMWVVLTIEAIVFWAFYLHKSPVHGKVRSTSRVVLVGLCALFAVLSITTSYIKSRAGERGIEELQNNIVEDVRPGIWAYAGERFLEHPLIGFGFGRGILRKDLKRRFDHPMVWHGHNLLVNYALEMGLLGIAALLLLLGSLVKEFWKFYAATHQDVWELGIAGLVLMAGLITKSMTDDTLVRENSLLFWALMGMTLGLGRRLTTSSDDPKQVFRLVV